MTKIFQIPRVKNRPQRKCSIPEISVRLSRNCRREIYQQQQKLC